MFKLGLSCTESVLPAGVEEYYKEKLMAFPHALAVEVACVQFLQCPTMVQSSYLWTVQDDIIPSYIASKPDSLALTEFCELPNNL